MLPDDVLPQVPVLLGRQSRPLLATALEPAGVEVLHARPTQVRYEPGRSIVVRYATRVREAGSERVDTLVASAHRDGLPDGVAVLEQAGGMGQVGVWRYPNDPWLPGLRSVVYAEGARAVLAQLGIGARDVSIQPLVYRPGQRAVLRIVAQGVELYAKLVRPERAAQVHRAHAALRSCSLVPMPLGWSRDHGLVVLQALPGDRLGDRLGRGGPAPSPRSLLTALDEIAGTDVGTVPFTARGGSHHLRLLRAVVPEAGAVLDELEDAAAFDLPADRTIHGDFYEGQVLVRGREVAGLLDLDGARPGHVVEDLATLSAHLDGLALVRPGAAHRIRAYRREVERLALAKADGDQLRGASTRVLLGLATGPFRLQEADWPARTAVWLTMARDRLDGSRRLASRAGAGASGHAMSDFSPRDHPHLTPGRDSELRKATTTTRTRSK